MIAADLAARRPPRPPRPRIIWALLRTLISVIALSCLRTSASTSPPFANTYLYAPHDTDLHYCVLLLNEPAFGHFLLSFNPTFDTTIISPAQRTSTMAFPHNAANSCGIQHDSRARSPRNCPHSTAIAQRMFPFIPTRTFRSPARAARTMSSFCQISGDASAALTLACLLPAANADLDFGPACLRAKPTASRTATLMDALCSAATSATTRSAGSCDKNDAQSSVALAAGAGSWQLAAGSAQCWGLSSSS